MLVRIHLLPLDALALHLNATFLPIARAGTSALGISTPWLESGPLPSATLLLIWTSRGRLGRDDWNKTKASVKTWWEKERRKKKKKDAVTKLLTLAASRSRPCVYSMKLKFNICHVTRWSQAWIPTETKDAGGNRQKVCVHVCVWFSLQMWGCAGFIEWGFI